MKRALLILVPAGLVWAACASPRAAISAAEAIPPASSAPAQPAPPPRAPAEDPALVADADAAVTDLATLLSKVEVACRDELLSSSGACEKSLFAPIAARYQRIYGKRPDARADEGRIDALPRLGGPGAKDEEVTWRIELACDERCDLARRTAIADAVDSAAERCVKDPKVGKKACQELAKRSSSPSSQASRVAEKCESECASRTAEAKRRAEWERTRPRTVAASKLCFRDCMSRCTGGRIVPPLDRPFVPPADEWCGTCQVSCESDCAVR